MKHLFVAVVFTALLLSLLPTRVYAQSSGTALAPGYYIVVAAYRLGQEGYAESYRDRINKDGLHAAYGKDIGRKYLYVYLDYFADYDQSIQEMLKVRKEGGFAKAWVRIMKGDMDTTLPPVAKVEPNTPVETINQKAAKPAQKQGISESPQEPKEPVEVVEVVEASPETLTSVRKEEEAPVEIKNEEPAVEEDEIIEPVDLAEASVYLSLFDATNNKQLDGEVEVVDTDRARLITKVKGNEYIKLPDPKSKSGKVALIANIFGYRPIQHDINYLSTPADTLQPFVEWAGNHYLVKFDLVRYHKGDVQTLYNVYFYNDAAIMLPESKYQLNELLEMMKENPNYRIKLHGHTNGNSRGRLITMGPSKQFFALADDVKDGSGSAKALSGARAEVIKEWLISKGIAADRMEVKAWGGGRMLHDKNSANAKKNVRVDVEILEE